MSEGWSDEELEAACHAYMKMAQFEAARRPYSKRDIYRTLASRFGRTEKAFEYRMQNISAVLDELGKEWIPGLKPAGNVGANVKPRIISIFEAETGGGSAREQDQAAYKSKLPALREWLIEIARNTGRITYGEVMEAFGIDRFSLRHAMDYLGHQADNLDEPIITALIIGKRTRRCSEGLDKEFGVQDDESERLRLYDYWKASTWKPQPLRAGSLDREVKAARFVSVEARPDQAAFRRRVYLACQGRCVISGCEVLEVLDAAHKRGRDWRLGHNSAADGYLLRKDLHALYDSGLLRITDVGSVELDSSVQAHYASYEGTIVRTKG